MIIVTGGAGFIGSNIVKGLNDIGRKDIIVVDNLKNGFKFKNLVDLDILDFIDKADFLSKMNTYEAFSGSIEAIFHQGACSSTVEWDGRYMLQNNYEYSKSVLAYCLDQQIPLIYASSAAVYGKGKTFKEVREFECPLNVYGYSKFLFDEHVRRIFQEAKSQIAGFRYFNVYGPREGHKGGMASVAFHLNTQIQDGNSVRLFKGSGGYGDGEQRRDFVCIDDVVAVNLWFLKNKNHSGIFNLGTGRSQTFNEVAQAVIGWHTKGEIQYIPFPDKLRDAYQSFTEADISTLRNIGYTQPFKDVEEGVSSYMAWLNTKP